MIKNLLYDEFPDDQLHEDITKLREDGLEQEEVLRAVSEGAHETPADVLAEEICIREARNMSLALSQSASAASDADATGVPAEIPDTSSDAAIAEAMSSDFAPGPRRTNISHVPSLEYDVVTLDYEDPRIELLTRPSPESPPLPWQDVDSHFMKQAKR